MPQFQLLGFLSFGREVSLRLSSCVVFNKIHKFKAQVSHYYNISWSPQWTLDFQSDCYSLQQLKQEE